MSKKTTDEIIHLLMDAELTPKERQELELLLANDPNARNVSDFEKAKFVNSVLKEVGTEEIAELQTGNQTWENVKKSILAGQERSTPSLLQRIVEAATIPRLNWALAGATAIALFIGLWAFLPSQSRATHSTFGSVSDLKGYKSGVSATSYDSRSGDATIVWVSGLGDATEFGNILQVYSFKPEVTATAYNSDSGDATIIWVSGLDEDAGAETSS